MKELWFHYPLRLAKYNQTQNSSNLSPSSLKESKAFMRKDAKLPKPLTSSNMSKSPKEVTHHIKVNLTDATIQTLTEDKLLDYMMTILASFTNNPLTLVKQI